MILRTKKKKKKKPQMEEEQPLHRHKRQCSSVQENDRSGSGVDRTPVITEAVVEPTPDESTQM